MRFPMIIPAYVGEVVHHLKDGTVRRWRPKPNAPMLIGDGQLAEKNPIEHLGAGGTRGARFFVGLNVGDVPTHTPEQVIDLVYKIRKAQGASGDVSVLVQLGIYEDSKGRRIDEESVQVIVLDLSGDSEFVKQMLDLGERLRIDLKQERVIIELQRGGVTQDVYSATDPKLMQPPVLTREVLR
jgi:hypothetical protein